LTDVRGSAVSIHASVFADWNAVSIVVLFVEFVALTFVGSPANSVATAIFAFRLTLKRFGLCLGNETWIALAAIRSRAEAIDCRAVILARWQTHLGGWIQLVSFVATTIVGRYASPIGTTTSTLGYAVVCRFVQQMARGTDTAARRLAGSSTTSLAVGHTSVRNREKQMP